MRENEICGQPEQTDIKTKSPEPKEMYQIHFFGIGLAST